MDKNPQGLDPKLKEAYDRVMGTTVNPPPASTPIQAPPPQQQTTTVNPVSTPTPVSPPEPQSHPFVANAGNEKKGISPVFLLLGGIVFFAVYAVFWMRIFGLF